MGLLQRGNYKSNKSFQKRHFLLIKFASVIKK